MYIYQFITEIYWALIIGVACINLAEASVTHKDYIGRCYVFYHFWSQVGQL